MVVAINLPLLSKATKEGVAPFTKTLLPVRLVEVELVKSEEVAFIVPFTEKRLEPERKVKLAEVAIVVFPCPNRMLPVPKVTRAMFGLTPPVEVREPFAVTELT